MSLYSKRSVQNGENYSSANYKKKYSQEEAYFKLSALCAAAEYCEADMRKKMQKWELPEGAEDTIIDKLIKERFIDEERFARAFVRDKYRYNKWGRVRIAIELKKKRIDPNIIEDALEEIPEDDNLDNLKNIIESKRRTVKGKSDYDIKCKLIRFALSRGFVMSDIEKVIDITD